MVVVAGIVIVLVNFRCNVGNNLRNILDMISNGVGNPPNPLFLPLSSEWLLTGTSVTERRLEEDPESSQWSNL